jgi:hypothetical protein
VVKIVTSIKKTNQKNHVSFMPHAITQNKHPFNQCVLNQIEPFEKSWFLVVKCAIIASEGFWSLLFFQVSLPFAFMILFLQLIRPLEHNMFSSPFVTHFGFYSFASNLGPFSLLFLSLLLCVLFNEVC